MKISIITPIYNAVNTIEQTILSVINQKINSELEYIVIDGGSTDGSIEVINRYLDKINIFITERDKGVYDAINKGITYATGDVIGIINSDDWYTHDSLQIVEKIFLQEKDVSIIYSPIDNYLGGKYLNTFIPGELDNLVFKFILNHPSCFVKKLVYDKIGLFDLSYSIAADYDFIFRAYASGFHFQYIETSLACYSLNGMTGKLTNKLRLLKESWQVSYKFMSKNPREIKLKHRRFYINWFLREMITFPIKILDPFVVIKAKSFLRKKIGKFSSDQYGSW